MAIEATERWSESRLFLDADLNQWNATRSFDVAHAPDGNAALAAVASTFGVVRNAPHPLNSTLKCKSVDATRPGFTVFRVLATYVVLQGASTDDDPLKQPAKIRWQPSLTGTQIDSDYTGYPIINAAGQPIDPPVNSDETTMTLLVSRYEPFYSPFKATRYMKTQNADTFFIRGKPQSVQILPGQARFMNYLPSEDYYLNAPYVHVQYSFEFRKNNIAPAQSWGAWDIRVPNRGSRGWYIGPSNQRVMGKFKRHGQDVEDDVYLNILGQPLDPNITVEGQNPVANPNPLPSSVVKVETVSVRSMPGGVAYFLHFRRFQPVAYAGII